MQSVIESTIITMKAAGLWRPKRRGFVTVNMESMPADAVRVQPRPDGSVRLYARKFTPSRRVVPCEEEGRYTVSVIGTP